MKKRKLATIALASAMMVTSFAACGNSDTSTTSAPAATTQANTSAATSEAATTEASTEPVTEQQEAKLDPSIDFEDDKFGFVKVKTGSGADKSELSVGTFNGSKALKVTNVDGGNMFVGINVSALLGDKIADLAEIRIEMGTENPDKFAASSGTLYCYTGEDNKEVKAGNWSVYVENANPKVAKFDVSNVGFVAGKDNYVVLSKETDNSKTTPSHMWLDNITFVDKNGATIKADSSAEFGEPSGFSTSSDRANLLGITKAVDWAGYSVSAGAWAQAGVAFTDEVKAALVPGSVLEITFQSSTGHLWVVMNESAAGWMRVGVGDWDGSGQQYARINNAGNTCQITYEQIAAVCGEDVSTWGSMIQCESDGDWSVSSVKVGMAAPSYALTHAVNFEGFAVKGDAWAQAGATMTDEVKAALVPGSVVEVSYKADTGHIWLVMNESAAGWMRVGVGDYDGSGQGYIVADGSKAYIPFELIAQYCSDDVSTWGSGFQCESDGPWEVYGVRVGTAAEFKACNSHVDLGANGIKGAGWAQDGIELTDEMKAALVAGSVIDINYTSETGEIWIVMPDAEAGWKRVGVGDFDGSGQGYALFDGSHCQISYEMIAEQCGEDVSKWGGRIQFEATSNWTVNSASIGNVK